ncbi:MAG TPA: hypothetical protein VER58_01210 [Thermoanaerobaculia bacterium]|nr:hypothetical protein [Thermoanaerobaculia bacterium]
MSSKLSMLLLSFFLAFSLCAQSGHWEGTIRAAEKDVKIEFDLTKNGGTFNLPARNLKALPLSNVVVHDGKVTFEIKGAGGGTFEGTLSADGQSIEGTFAMRGPDPSQSMEMPFSLKRTGDARIEEAPKSAPIGKELEGKWSGTLEVEGKQKQVGITLTNYPDGSSTGTLTSDGMQIAINTIVQKGNSITLDVKNVGGSYSGTLQDDGTIAGTWTQPPFVGPLDFKRSLTPLDRWANAVGGRDKVAAIRSIYREATIEISGMTGTIKVWHTAEGKYRKEEQVATFSSIETFDGTNGTVKQGAAPARPMSGHELEVAMSKAWANANAILFAFDAGRHHGTVVTESDGTIVLKPQGGIDWRVTLDPETSLPKTMVHMENNRTITVTFAAYETIDGIKFEKELHRSTGDPRFDAVIRFTKTIVNPPIEASLFSIERPASE